VIGSATDIQVLEESVLRSIRRLMRAVDLYSRQLRAACDLTGPQLACLRQIGVGGPMTLSDLAARVSLSPATVSGILDRLEAKAMVSRERQADDKRRVFASLTREGRAAVRRAPPPVREQFSRQFRALSGRKQAELERALRDIVAMMEAQEVDVSPFLASPAELPGASRT